MSIGSSITVTVGKPGPVPAPTARLTPKSDTPLVFLDTECTGVHPGRQAWEVAMIRRDQTGQREIQFFVDVDLSNADPHGLAVGRFYDRHPQGQALAGQFDRSAAPAYTRQQAGREIAKWTHGAHIVGAVPNFDTEVLSRLLRNVYILPVWHYHLADVENLAVGYLAGKGQVLPPPWNSDLLTAKLGLEPVAEAERHTALGDARWAMAVYDRVMGGAA